MHSATTPHHHRFDLRSAAASVAIWMLAGGMLVGCRSSRPPGSSMVQVTEEPAAVSATLPAPEQRLATARLGKAKPAAEQAANVSADETSALTAAGSGGKSSDSTATAGRSTAGQTDSKRRVSVAQAATESVVAASADEDTGGSEPVERAVATGAMPPESAASARSSQPTDSPSSPTGKTASPTGKTAQTDQGDPSNAGNPTVGGLVSASLTDLTRPVATAKKPEVEKDVMRSDEGAAAKQIESDSEVAQAAGAGELSQSADLPGSESIVASESLEAVPKRRASRQPGRPDSGKPNGLDAALADSLENLPELPATSELEVDGPTPTRIGEDREPSVAMNVNRVKPVSHSGDTERFATRKPAKDSETRAGEPSRSTKDWSTEELYKELLTRVSAIRDSEDATERERRQIIARYLMVLAGDPESAVVAMDGLNENEQQYLKNHLLGLWTLIDPAGHPSSGRRITEALPRYRRAIDHMAAATDSLALASLEFCTEIEAYGQIKPFTGNRFNAGQQVIVYCEVENFSAAERESGYQTRLQGSYDIYDGSGTKVVSQLLPLDEQQSRNRLRDYFVAYQMNLPKQLSPGTYRLQLTIEDLVGKKYGQSNIPFEIR